MEPNSTDERALTALLRAQAAHARLDGINGQIGRLGDEVSQARIEIAKIKTRAGTMAALGAFVATAVIAPLLVGLTLKFMSPGPKAAPSTPPVATATAR